MKECTACPGYCCIRQPGAVLLVDAEDIYRLARHLGVKEGDLRRRFMENRHSFKVREDGSCIFRDATRFAASCTIYPARPRQCREFPYSRPCPYLEGR
ncbi:MAG: YkgJ family cysteine cluster protein [Deltaproteobacteria bacterium]